MSFIKFSYQGRIFPMIIIITCLLAKWWHVGADNQSLVFLTQPLNTLVSVFSGSLGFFDPEIGFYHKNLQIVIDKSCAGFNFMVISFGSIFSVFYRSDISFKTGFCFYLIAASLAYVLTLFANTSRILISIRSLHFSDSFPWMASDTAHEVIGSALFVCCLFITCLFIYYLKSRNTHA